MKEVKVKLDDIDKVKNFVATASQFATDLDLVSDKYVIDAKSILGIFSLNLREPVLLRIEDDDEAGGSSGGIRLHRGVAFPDRKEKRVEKYRCTVCGYEYDPATGDPDRGVAADTPFSDLPDAWVCPLCGAGKDKFEREGVDPLLVAVDLSHALNSEDF